MNIKNINIKSVLIKSKLPDTDYVINPYVGCQFACAYCYACFMGRFIGGESIEGWGTYLYPKINSVEVFKKEYEKLISKKKLPSILLSSVTDPYQGIEKKIRLTRGILELLAANSHPATLSILTKSPLVIRDIDLFKKIPHSEVGITITSADDVISHFFESKAPSIKKRLHALRELNNSAIKTYVFIGPLFPHFLFMPEKLELLIAQIKNAGATSVYVEHLNMRKYILRRLKRPLEQYDSTIQEMYENKKMRNEYKNELAELMNKLLIKYDLRLRLNEIISHDTIS